MLGRSSRPRGGDNDAGVSQPLLHGSDEDLPATAHNNVLFSVDDDAEDNEDDLPLATTDGLADQTKPGHVRFQEEVQVIAPPLRSTMTSRETGA